ncbi:flagellar biosynthetic protein FliO [Clostridium cadaveris]|mgnify:CR=1 FL=1|uniref:flagellar biosynthetic protein FliO n=1 Tax=Clostridium cadaveris TaxID=1529 RepID=UPI0015B4CD33|nr:flagellar biosynthetic protein FliO [Clostridium cadaveris]NWK12607.1 flagellar biosynthetic protein FliO [Clostridium cadaveris]UFH63598.1 flagellar biosynthetic protein FliO [Clostridium cadaveris]
MDKTLIEYLINIIVLVPVVLILIVISLKLSKSSVDKLNSGSYVNIIEKINISKDTSIYVIKMGSTGCVAVVSPGNTEIIKELNEEELEEIVDNKKKKYKAISIGKLSLWNKNNILRNKLVGEKHNGYDK